MNQTRAFRWLAAVITAAALVFSSATAATAATSKPGTPGLIDFVGASLTSSGATLSVDWANVPRATGYDVFWGTSRSNVDRGKYVAPLGSDPHPLVVRLGLA